MKNKLSLILFLIPFVLHGQDFVCGFKEDCECVRTKEDISFETSEMIFEGKVLFIDTVSLGSVITTAAKLNIEQSQDTITSCARLILKKEKVVVVKIEVKEIFKGTFQKREIYICTPIEKKNCAYVSFQKDKNFIVYSGIDETADIFFTYNLKDDYFILKEKYKYWTNYCRCTKRANKKEIEILRALREKNKEGNKY